MPKKLESFSAHYVRTLFKFSDETVGAMRHRMVDLSERVVDVAAEFGCHPSTAYRIRAAVPADLIEVDEASHQRRRRNASKRWTKAKVVA